MPEGNPPTRERDQSAQTYHGEGMEPNGNHGDIAVPRAGRRAICPRGGSRLWKGFVCQICRILQSCRGRWACGVGRGRNGPAPLGPSLYSPALSGLPSGTCLLLLLLLLLATLALPLVTLAFVLATAQIIFELHYHPFVKPQQ